jgi:ferric-dicitrate binding protein FerR (iron transport regulator)
MNEDFYISLIYQRLNGEISDEASQSLNDWLSASPENQTLAVDLEEVYNESESYLIEDIADIDINAAFEAQLNLIEPAKKQATKRESTNSATPKKRSLNISRWVSIAAVLLLGVLAVFWWQDVQSSNAGEKVFAVAEEGIKVLNLSDGSEVTLEQSSELAYSTQFTDEFRLVELKQGRAKFAVAKDKGTFQVKTPLGLVTVLGTVFTVKLENNGAMRVNVSEGKVNIQPLENAESSDVEMNATAGEEVVLIGGAMSKIKFEADKQLNYFEFQHMPLVAIYETLNGFFDSNLKIKETESDCFLNGTFNNNTLEEILEVLEKLKAECN